MSDKRDAKPAAGGPMGHGGAGMMMAAGGAKAKDARGTTARLLARLSAQRLAIGAVLAMTSAAVGLSLIGPKLLGDATTKLFDGLIGGMLPVGADKASVIADLRARGDNQLADMIAGMDITPGVGVDFDAIGKLILAVVAIYAIASFLNWMQGYIMAGVAQRAVFELRRDVDHKLSRLPLAHVDKQGRGDLLSRVTNDIDNIAQSMQQGLSQLVSSILTVVGTLVVMFILSPVLALVSLLIVPLSGFLMMVVGKKAQTQYKALWAETGRVNSHVEEMHSGHAVVLAFGRRERALEEFDELNEAMYQAGFKSGILTGLMQPRMYFLATINYVAVAVIGAVQVAGGHLSIGSVQAFIQYSRQFSMPLGQIAGLMTQLQSGIASAERVFELLDGPEEPVEPRGSMQRLEDARGEVVLQDVSFRYLPDTPLIEDFSLRVAPGESVAIVGPTGAGKTTIVNLLMRFYEIDGGTITVDGVDTRAIAREDVRSLFGMVLQDTWLFKGTIRENIEYGRRGATFDEVVAAAKDAHADHFIRTLPHGYDTVLDDDATNISVGERQLLTIARAFLADPTVLILDEATSNVDTRTEVLIQRAMNELRKGRTSFVIAHRLSTIRNADTIIVMDKGRIVEQGNHDQLVAADGFYKRLYDSQFAE